MTNFEVIVKEHPQFVKEVLAHCINECVLKEVIAGDRELYALYNGLKTDDNAKMRFLNRGYVQPVLDNIEKKYLSDVIRPFKRDVKSIRKSKCDSQYFIEINMVHAYDRVCLPYFRANSGMYKGMELNKMYTLKDLGL